MAKKHGKVKRHGIGELISNPLTRLLINQGLDELAKHGRHGRRGGKRHGGANPATYKPHGIAPHRIGMPNPFSF